jgi:vancomycin resistance protein YoaR
VTVELPTAAQAPDIRVADLAEPRQDVRQVMAEHVAVEFEGTTWTLNRQELASFLAVETRAVDGEPDVVLTMDEKKLATLLRQKFADKVNRQPVNAEVRWDDGLFAKEPSIDGITLKASSFAAVVSDSFLGDHDTVEIPVVVTKPKVDDDNLEALKVETRIGQGDSNYEGGSPERNKNVEIGTSLLNGTLVEPGTEFSFNEAIGDIDKKKGYVVAAVVEDGRVGEDVGGGICQVSTTMFRAALRSGMPITTWNPHTYRIKSYERDGWTPGYDASILQEGEREYWGDFKFKNDTDGWLYVEAWTEYPKVIVNIYGPDLGWKVDFSKTRVSEPIKEEKDIEHVDEKAPRGTMKQTEFPMDGYEVQFVRTVTDRDGKELWDRNFYTRFKGRGNVWTVSPDMKGKSPAAKSGDGETIDETDE